MNQDQIKAAIVESLLSVAPEVDPEKIDPGKDLREQCDLDSMDFLNFVIGIHHSLGVDIPEVDYPSFISLEKAAAYVERTLAVR